jgi:ABC-type lipoprotein export system ATPase subunit
VAALSGVRSRGLADVELTLHRGDRVAVTGPNGAGKTTLLDVLAGVLVPAAGTAELAGRARMLPQTPIALPAQERVVDWLRAQAGMDEGAARTLLGAFALDTAAVHRPLGSLSPGERARVHMAAMVASGAELLLLDEPTNHLDPRDPRAVEGRLRGLRRDDRRGLPRSRLPRGARVTRRMRCATGGARGGLERQRARPDAGPSDEAVARERCLHHAAHVGHATAAPPPSLSGDLGDDRLGGEDVLGDRGRRSAAQSA